MAFGGGRDWRQDSVLAARGFSWGPVAMCSEGRRCSVRTSMKEKWTQKSKPTLCEGQQWGELLSPGMGPMAVQAGWHRVLPVSD